MVAPTRVCENLDTVEAQLNQRFEPGATNDSIRSEEARLKLEQLKGNAEEQFAGRSSAEMLAILEAQDIACAPVLNVLST